MIRPVLLIGVAISASSLLASCSEAGRRAEPEDLRETLTLMLQHWDAPGAVVAVIDDGAIVFIEGFGSTMATGGVPVTPTTLAPVQSVSKSVTAVALSMLVDDGAIGWDDPIKRHLPEFEFGGSYLTEHITIRDLMTHRSGLPFLLGGWDPSAYDMTDVMRDLRSEEPAIELRTGVYYSQVGMALLGEIIERVSGETWSEFVQHRILDPLHMDSSYPDDLRLITAVGEPESLVDLMKTVGRSDGLLQDPPWERYNELWWPAAALITTAEDMTKYMRFLLSDGSVDGQVVLSAELISEMFSPTAIPGVGAIAPLEPILAPRTEVFAYGLGWMLHEEFGRLIAEHTGGGRSSATVALMPQEKLGVFVVTNAAYGYDSARLVSALKFAAFEHFLGLPESDWIRVLGQED